MDRVIAWVDVESGGINPGFNSFLEVAVVFTDFSGNILAEPYSSLVSVKDVHKVILESNEFIQKMHDTSGLWRDLWSMKAKPAEQIDLELVEILKSVSTNESTFYFGGNSPILDRRYAEMYLPTFYKEISHMSIDVTTLSLVLQESGDAKMFVKRGEHRALSDVFDSIDEYKHYQKWIAAN